jgi:hypothetical protein
MKNIKEAILKKTVSKKEIENQKSAESLKDSRNKTIHIFGNGETQIIGKEKRSKVNSSSLNSLKNVVENIISKKPSDFEFNADDEYLSINIVVGKYATFIPKGKVKKPFTVKYSDLNQDFITDLINEMPVADKPKDLDYKRANKIPTKEVDSNDKPIEVRK